MMMPDMGGGGSPASAMGGAGGGFGSADMWGNLAAKMFQHNAERNQRGLQTALNADMMQYSPWTKLAGQSASSQDKNMQWVPGKDLSQNIMSTLGFAKQQDALNERQGVEDAFNNKWLDIYAKKGT